MDLERSNSDVIEKSFHESLKAGDSSFLLDTDELKMEDVVRLRTDTSDGPEVLGSCALQESLLTLDTGGLPEDEWLVASPSEMPTDKPRGFIVPGDRIRNPRDAILSSAPTERSHLQAQAELRPVVQTRKRSISLPEPARSAALAERSKAAGASSELQTGMLGIKTPKPGTLGAMESFTPSPPRLTMGVPGDRWAESKIPRSPLAKPPAASIFAADTGATKGSSPSKLPSPGAVPPSPKRQLTPRATTLTRNASPKGETRIPKPRTSAHAGGSLTPETRKQRYALRPTPEHSSPSGSSAGGRSSGRPRSAKPKPKLEDLEKGWVGNEVPKEDESEGAPFAGDEALKLADELSDPNAKTRDGGAIGSGPVKFFLQGSTTNVEAVSSNCKVDASTQVTPKSAGATDGGTQGGAQTGGPVEKGQACACCDIM